MPSLDDALQRFLAERDVADEAPAGVDESAAGPLERGTRLA